MSSATPSLTSPRPLGSLAAMLVQPVSDPKGGPSPQTAEGEPVDYQSPFSLNRNSSNVRKRQPFLTTLQLGTNDLMQVCNPFPIHALTEFKKDFFHKQRSAIDKSCIGLDHRRTSHHLVPYIVSGKDAANANYA